MEVEGVRVVMTAAGAELVAVATVRVGSVTVAVAAMEREMAAL